VVNCQKLKPAQDKILSKKASFFKKWAVQKKETGCFKSFGFSLGTSVKFFSTLIFAGSLNYFLIFLW